MTQQDKELLLKDLCARLPYGTRVNYNGLQDYTLNLKTLCCFPEEQLRPHLRRMSSMTEEEYRELLTIGHTNGIATNKWFIQFANENQLDWLNAHHFDYRGLIDKGLAIAVTEENDPYKD